MLPARIAFGAKVQARKIGPNEVDDRRVVMGLQSICPPSELAERAVHCHAEDSF